MATPPRDTPPPVKSGTVPAPGSLPKLPQTIFNLEKRDGAGEDTGRRPA